MNRSAFQKVTHCIFDMDGLLLDTETLYTTATQNVVSRYGKTYDWSVKSQVMGLLGFEVAEKTIKCLELPITPQEYLEIIQEQRAIADIAKSFGKIYTPQIRSKVFGRVGKETARVAIQEMKLPLSTEEFLKKFVGKTRKSLNVVHLLPGAERLLLHFHHSNIPIALATSSSKESYDLKVVNHKELFSLFSHQVLGGSDPDVKKGKPAPDVFLVCRSRFADKPSPEQCLVFEDSPNGVQAARAAGMQVVMVPDNQVDEKDRKEATLVLNSLEEFKPEEFGLPPFKNRFGNKR